MHAPAWLSPPTDLALPDGAVHLWRAALDRPPTEIERLAASLSPEEQERAARFVSPRARGRFAVGRGLVRAILGRYLDLEPSRVHFQHTPQGKPYLDPAHHAADLQFSMAHSRALALLAVTAGRRIGVDVEHERPLPNAERIAARYFAPEERTALLALPQPERLSGFFACWTLKEAWLKATSAGLGGGLATFAVSFPPTEVPRLLRVAGDPDTPTRWSLLSLVPAPGCFAALAVEGQILAPAFWDLRSLPLSTA